MSHGRSIDGNSDRAYRVVIEYPTTTKHRGPYSTLPAARGVYTRAVQDAERWHKDSKVKVWIEETQPGWRKVELP